MGKWDGETRAVTRRYHWQEQGRWTKMLVPTGCPLEMIILQTLPYESEYIVFPKSSQNLMVFISLWIGMSHHILIIFSTIEKYCTVWEDGQTRQFQTQPVKGHRLRSIARRNFKTSLLFSGASMKGSITRGFCWKLLILIHCVYLSYLHLSAYVYETYV